MVVRNKSGAIVPILKKTAGPMVASAVTAVGTHIVRNGRDYFWNGMNWLGRSAWNRLNNPRSLPTKDLIVAPVATTRVIRGQKPRFTSVRGSIRITHREYVTQLNGVSDGTYLLNRGLGPTYYALAPYNFNVFPWLTSISRNFDSYKFISATLHYVPMCSTTEIGRVGLFWDKDSGDTGPDDRSELAHHQHLVETPPWSPSTLVIPCGDGFKFINDTNVVDRKLVDHGRLGYVVYGTSTGNALGDLFIEYTIELKEPQPGALFSQETAGVGGITSTSFGPNIATAQPSSTTNFVVNNWSTGSYLVTVVFAGVTTNSAATSSNNAQLTINSQTSTGTVTRAIWVISVTVNSPGNNLNLPFTGTLSNWNIFISPVTKQVNITA